METEQRIPRHIAIIMDGNGRWAERHGVERVEGHRMGAVAVKKLIENLADTGVEYVTLYAFSTENWKRSKEEVDALMELLCEFIDANLSVMIEKGLRLMVTGRMWGLPEKSREYLNLAIEKTASNRRGTLILALNYGGRAEIADTAKKIAQDVMLSLIHI